MQNIEGETNPESAAEYFENENPQLNALLVNVGFDINEIFEEYEIDFNNIVCARQKEISEMIEV